MNYNSQTYFVNEIGKMSLNASLEGGKIEYFIAISIYDLYIIYIDFKQNHRFSTRITDQYNPQIRHHKVDERYETC